MSPTIIKYKLTRRNKSGALNAIGNIKLLGIDVDGKEHYLQFVSQTFAIDLVNFALPGEVDHTEFNHKY